MDLDRALSRQIRAQPRAPSRHRPSRGQTFPVFLPCFTMTISRTLLRLSLILSAGAALHAEPLTVDNAITHTDIRLESKTGGKSGDYQREANR